MKVVGFKRLKEKKNNKKCFILCFSNVFTKLMIISSVILFLLILNLVSKTFLSDVTASLEQFVQSFVRFS